VNDSDSRERRPDTAVSELDHQRKAAIRGAFYSEFVDMFDIYLPVVALAPVLGYFQPPAADAPTANVLGSLVFVTTLLGRPVGALTFGLVADRLGRRTASIYSVTGFSIVTFAIALLPGYQSIGIYSYVLLVALRFLDGIFLGGGYTGAHPLALEYSKKHQRGFVGGLIMSAFPASYVAINLLAAGIFMVFPRSEVTSPYAQWGWRIPFVVGAVLAGLLAVYYVRHVSESNIWKIEKSTAKGQAPLRELVSGKAGRSLLQVLIMMTGFWTTQNIITIYMPSTLLLHSLHLSKLQVSSVLLITYGLLTFSYIGAGLLGQAIGRRRCFLILGVLIATVGSCLLYVLARGQGLPFAIITLLVCALAILVTAPWGIIVTYINERFATEVRATGFGVGFSLSVILPSFYAFYLNWLSRIVPEYVAPVVLLCAGALIATLGAALGPETKDVDFRPTSSLV
jgi:MFS family permease